MQKLFRPPKTQDTQEFYSNLMNNECHKEHIWGKTKRFNPDKSINSPSIKTYFTNKIFSLIKPTDKVIDIGCGLGMFLPSISPLCKELIGIDVSPAFVEASLDTIARFGLKNTNVIMSKSEELPFPDNEFDLIIMVDVIHHVYYLSETISEMKRVSKPGSKIIIYEPNILNPALFLMCLFDRNEWGALGLGRKNVYAQLFSSMFDIECIEYNGLLIGPDSQFSLKIADFLNNKSISPFLGWLNPKIFISMINKKQQ